jgi:hypothetical protein
VGEVRRIKIACGRTGAEARKRQTAKMAKRQSALVGLAFEDKGLDPKQERPTQIGEMDWR